MMKSSAKMSMSTVVTGDLAPEVTDYMLMMAFSQVSTFQPALYSVSLSFCMYVCLFTRLPVCQLFDRPAILLSDLSLPPPTSPPLSVLSRSECFN